MLAHARTQARMFLEPPDAATDRLDLSGALAWADAVPRAPNGLMRSWLDVAATADLSKSGIIWCGRECGKLFI